MREQDRTPGLKAFDSNIGNLGRVARKDAKMTLHTLAKHFGISADYLSRFERGLVSDSELVDLYWDEFGIRPSRIHSESRAFIAGLDSSRIVPDSGVTKILKKLDKANAGIDALKTHCHIPK